MLQPWFILIKMNTVFFISILSCIVIGCSSLSSEETEDSGIYVYNYDSENIYRVELYLSEGETLVSTLYLDSYPNEDYDGYLEDLSESYYYISIFQSNGSEETGRSAVFFLEEEETLSFTIESPWNIENDSIVN